MIELEQIERELLLRLINSGTFSGAIVPVVAKLIEKLECITFSETDENGNVPGSIHGNL